MSRTEHPYYDELVVFLRRFNRAGSGGNRVMVLRKRSLDGSRGSVVVSHPMAVIPSAAQKPAIDHSRCSDRFQHHDVLRCTMLDDGANLSFFRIERPVGQEKTS